VIGVVENARMGQIIERESFAQYYLPLENLPTEAKNTLGGNYLALRVGPEHFADVSNEVRTLIRQHFPGGIPSITRLSDYIDPQYRPWRLGALLFTGFGVLALVVSVVGIYSTVSYGVNQRIHEFGVRIALGASIANVLRLVVGSGVRTVALGITIGIVLALIAGRLITSLLYGVAPNDPFILGSVAAMLLAISIFAALAPAWRAARVDPVTALRAD
jgi:ABC-type antimicrobial peptide transport system permease subunit